MTSRYAATTPKIGITVGDGDIMTYLEALRATIDTALLARPVAGLRAGCGYYVAEGRVWWYDTTALDQLVKPADWLPPWDVLAGEWEVGERS